MVEMGVGFHFPKTLDLDRTGQTHRGEVVTFQVDQHIVLPQFLGVLQKGSQVFFPGGLRLTFVGAADGSSGQVFAFFQEYGFGGAADDGERAGIEQK